MTNILYWLITVTIGTACLAQSALCWILEALCQGKQKK